MRKRGEMVERSFAHVLDRGGMRRAWLRGRENLISFQTRAIILENACTLSHDKPYLPAKPATAQHQPNNVARALSSDVDVPAKSGSQSSEIAAEAAGAADDPIVPSDFSKS
ncbi:hypothetical protein PBT88_09295 [Sphingomonas abietis]|uniref:Uncharacterized protein n=1 Tax=Sphingomonas abietis TaxID=3012344 RepID=A0ABY7NU03_9SPHN|nr:hypothetical protein [Sphingomonas abietis]WBO24270.1 hypothetical protein PBT88_09295 [Sphingomonas abietis]